MRTRNLPLIWVNLRSKEVFAVSACHLPEKLAKGVIALNETSAAANKRRRRRILHPLFAPLFEYRLGFGFILLSIK